MIIINSMSLLTNPRRNYLGGSRYGNSDYMLDRAAMEMVYMKEKGIPYNYQYDFYPYRAPNYALMNRSSSFGLNPLGSNQALNSMGIIGDYQYDFYPWPSPNGQMLSMVSQYGRRRKRRVNKKVPKISAAKRKAQKAAIKKEKAYKKAVENWKKNKTKSNNNKKLKAKKAYLKAVQKYRKTK